jgi:hypothetical protein
MKHLVQAALARDGTLNTLDPGRMTDAKHAFRSAARLGIKATAARRTELEKTTTRWPTDCSTSTMTTSDSPPTCGSLSTTTQPSARYG